MRPRMGQMGVQNVRLLSEFLLPRSCAPSSGRMSARPEAATEVLRGGQRGAGKGVRPRVRGCVLLIGLVSPPGRGAPGAGSRELEDAARPISRPREAGDMGNAARSSYPRTSAACHFKGGTCGWGGGCPGDKCRLQGTGDCVGHLCPPPRGPQLGKEGVQAPRESRHGLQTPGTGDPALHVPLELGWAGPGVRAAGSAAGVSAAGPSSGSSGPPWRPPGRRPPRSPETWRNIPGRGRLAFAGRCSGPACR